MAGLREAPAGVMLEDVLTKGQEKTRGRILVLATDIDEPSGGRKYLYWTVDILNQAGFEAVILHTRENFRYSWFQNQTRVGYSPIRWDRPPQATSALSLAGKFKHIVRKQASRLRRTLQRWQGGAESLTEAISIRANDILVIPETRGAYLHRIEPGIRKIILCQNHFFAFRGYPWRADPAAFPYSSEEVVAMVVHSRENFQFHQFVLKDLPLYRLRLPVERDEWYFVEDKKPQIAFMPRRGGEDARALLNALQSRGSLDGIHLVPIDGVSYEQHAAILRESLIFLAFSTRESFGLPPAEAMAAGCYVIGYDGCGGREYFDSSYCSPIRSGDLLGFAKAVEEALRLHRENPAKLTDLRRRASNAILEAYDFEEVRSETIATWTELLAPLLQKDPVPPLKP